MRLTFTRTQTNSVQTFDFFTADGDWDAETRFDAAHAGRDYIATRGSIAFLPGQSSAVVDVSIVDDGFVNGARLFRLETTNHSGGLELDLPEQLIRIEDNEVPPFLDPTFNPELEPEVDASSERIFVRSENDGRVFIGATKRLQANGAVDFSFKAPLDGALAPLGLFPDGALLAVDYASPTAARKLVRLRRDGSLDWTVAISSLVSAIPGPYGTTFVLSTEADEHGGLLTRLLPDGSPDTTFRAVHFDMIGGPSPTLTLAAGSKVVVYDLYLEHVNGEPNRFLFRVNPDGSIDRGFRPQFKAADLMSLLPQPDGKLVLSGSFDVGLTGDRRLIRTGIIRLNDDGSLDESFGSAEATQSLVTMNGQIFFLDGDLLGRLANDGTRDRSFAVGLNGYFWGYQGHAVPSLDVTPDGCLLAAVDLASQPGLSTALEDPPPGSVHRLIRIRPDPPAHDFRVVQSARFYRPPGLVRLQIVRTGDTTEAASVDYRTRDLTTLVKRDYVGLAGALFFKPLEVAKEVAIQLMPTDDPRPRELLVELDQPSPSDYAVSPPTIIQIAPAPQIVPESLRLGYDAEARRDYASMAVRFAKPGSTYSIESSSNLKDWLRISDADGFDSTVWVSPYVPSGQKQFFRAVGE